MINTYDVEIDEECIRVLALRQPMGGDLRFITTAMKITTDLERIGDFAENISKLALELNQEPQLKPYIDIPLMAKIVQGMVVDVLEPLPNRIRPLPTMSSKGTSRWMSWRSRSSTNSFFHDQGSFHGFPGGQNHYVAKQPGAHGRSRHQHRRDGDLYGGRQVHPPHVSPENRTNSRE